MKKTNPSSGVRRLQPEAVEAFRMYFASTGLKPPPADLVALDGQLRRFPTGHEDAGLGDDRPIFGPGGGAGWLRGFPAGERCHASHSNADSTSIEPVVDEIIISVPRIHAGCACGGCEGRLLWTPLPRRFVGLNDGEHRWLVREFEAQLERASGITRATLAPIIAASARRGEAYLAELEAAARREAEQRVAESRSRFEVN